jgi:hypothetical protein
MHEPSPEHTALFNMLKEQLLIVFLKRMGGAVEVPLEELNDTGQDLFLMRVDEDNSFHFSLTKKN